MNGSIMTMFRELGIEIDPSDIVSWLDSDIGNSGVQIYTGDEICELVSRSKDEIEPEDGDGEEDEEPCTVTNSDAARMFDRCLAWLEHQPEATVYNTSVLTLTQEKGNCNDRYAITVEKDNDMIVGRVPKELSTGSTLHVQMPWK